MDIWAKAFFYLGSFIAACLLIVVFYVLGTAEDGMLTTEGLEHMRPQLESFYAVFKWVVYIWLVPAAVMIFRMIRGFFGR